MATYNSPGVFVEEISSFPPSVAEVETAIPAFIGYTEKAERDRISLTNEPTRITSLLQYRQYFGGPPTPDTLEVNLDDENNATAVNIQPKWFLYDCLRTFFSNGGGNCYVVSVGKYDAAISLGDPSDAQNSPGFLVGLDAIKKYDEPTMLLFPDAVLLNDAGELANLQREALNQCATLMDRVAILDIFNGHRERDYTPADVVSVFRNAIQMKHLKYGAAYYPWIRTDLGYDVSYKDIELKKDGNPITLSSISDTTLKAYVDALDNALADVKTLKQYIYGNAAGTVPSLRKKYNDATGNNPTATLRAKAEALDDIFESFYAKTFGNDKITEARDFLVVVSSENPGPAFRGFAQKLMAFDKGWDVVSGGLDRIVASSLWYTDYDLANVTSPTGPDIYGPSTSTAEEKKAKGLVAFQGLFESILSTLESLLSDACQIAVDAERTIQEIHPVYKNIVKEIEKEKLTLPPSGAIAGVYASTDDTRGVWKAPANVSLSNVSAPAVNITSKEQEELNVDVIAGKSINVIRSFTGRGTLVWGARTLAGNDNEWRYISVRRFYNMVEESIKKSTMWAVFEPNDANTWIKVKAMIENYLVQKWRDGALAGAKPEQAFFVKVGLGITMTAQDILEGRMNVEIGMAVVRPAEFIVLKFSHKMQES